MSAVVTRGILRGAARAVAVLSSIALLACLLGACIGCSKIGDHSDEAIQIQGEWQVVGTRMTVTFTNNQIKLPGGTVYDYEIDTVNRTITFSVGDVSGEATYKITQDSELGTMRLELTEIVDGEEVTTVFAKLSDDTNAQPSKDGGIEAFSHDPNGESGGISISLPEAPQPEPAPEPVPAEGEPAPEAAAEPAPEEAPPPEEVPVEEAPPAEETPPEEGSFENPTDM